MKYVFKAFLLSILLLTALPLVAHAENFPQPQAWDQSYPFSEPVTLDNFTIIYNKEKVGDIPGLANNVLLAYSDTERVFGDSLSKSYIFKGYQANTNVFRVTVEVAGDNSEFRLLANNGNLYIENIPDGTNALDWNEGINGLIVIKSPAMLPDFRKVLSYHIARIAQRTIMTEYRSAPEWYLDGMAAFVAGNVTDQQRSKAMLVAVQGNWMSVSEMDEIYKNMTLTNTGEWYNVDARAQSAMLADYISQKYGSKALVGILKDYSENGNLEKAFVNYTGYTPEAINEDLRVTLAGNAPEQTDSNTGKLDGFLISGKGKVLSGYGISFARSGVYTNVTTDTSGHYSAVLTPGTYKITVPGQTLSGSDTVTVKKGESSRRNVTLVMPLPQDVSPTPTALNDLLLPGVAVAINIVALAAIIVILRRNWH